MESTRRSQSFSSWSSAARARRTASASVCTSLLAPAALLGDQPRPLEHGDVLLHRREAHRVRLREPRHRQLAPDGAARGCRGGSRRRAPGRGGPSSSSLSSVQPFGCRLSRASSADKGSADLARRTPLSGDATLTNPHHRPRIPAIHWVVAELRMRASSPRVGALPRIVLTAEIRDPYCEAKFRERSRYCSGSAPGMNAPNVMHHKGVI